MTQPSGLLVSHQLRQIQTRSDSYRYPEFLAGNIILYGDSSC